MLKLKADLHIHTVLSPCADLEMSPRNIVKAAINKGIDIIGITDHNSTLQCAMVKKLAAENNLFVLQGVEVTSREEVHNLAFFEDGEKLAEFQEFIELKQPKIKNKASKFGFQVVVDENDNIVNEIDNYLGMALNAGIVEIEEKVHCLGGIYIPAHINRPRYSLISQLGFVPANIKADALEIFNKTHLPTFISENSQLSSFSFVKNSDSHMVDSIGAFYSSFYIQNISFEEIKMALKQGRGRYVEVD